MGIVVRGPRSIHAVALQIQEDHSAKGSILGGPARLVQRREVLRFHRGVSVSPEKGLHLGNGDERGRNAYDATTRP